MQAILEIMKSDGYSIGVSICLALMILLYVINVIKLNKLNKNYTTFMKKIGKGENLQDALEKYVDNVEKVGQENKEIKNYCQQLDNRINQSIQKIGLVRYNAFKDTGSDLSFALALLDDKDNGIVLNGIYSRETSNIYAKPIEKGQSTYVLSEEEKEAINKAVYRKKG